jgi:diguanylate cyclase (GGDEF)-like protein
MNDGLQILVICKAAIDADLLGDDLLRAGYTTSLQWVNDEKTLQAALSKTEFDLALCEDQITNLDIVTVRSLSRESGQEFPFIVISDVMTPEAQRIASQIKAGVDDFVEWGKPERLISAVEQALHTSETRRQNRLAEQEILYRANFDSLTGLPNRTLMLDRLSQAMKKAQRDETGVILMFLDLDHFKAVNDSQGHLAGDLLLRQAAKRITACLRDTDTAARIGGDEFAIILPDAHQKTTAETIAGKLLKTLSQPFELDSQQASISASIGITVFPNDGEEAETLLENADHAMYDAKKVGRNAFKIFTNNSDTVFDLAPAARTVSLASLKAARQIPVFVKIGFALAASLALVIIASTWLASIQSKESLKIAIDENQGTLNNFSTASGPDN